MAYSNEFLRLIRKRAVGDEITAAALRSLFFDFLNEVPEELRWDIFNLFHPDLEDDVMILVSAAERLSIVIDLFEGEYEEDKLELTKDELKSISDGVNDFAQEITDDVLMNVMKAAVAKGLMG